MTLAHKLHRGIYGMYSTYRYTVSVYMYTVQYTLPWQPRSTALLLCYIPYSGPGDYTYCTYLLGKKWGRCACQPK